MDISSLHEQTSLSAKLLKALSADSSLQSLVAIGHELLQNPFSILDLRANVLAITGESSVEDDPVWNETVHTASNSLQTFSYYVDNKLIEKIAESDAPFFWSDAYSKYPRIIGKIMIEGEHLAHIIVCAHQRNFNEGDLNTVSLLCQAVSIELQKSKYVIYSRELSHEAFLYDLLEGIPQNLKHMDKQLNQLRLALKSILCVITVDISNWDKTISTLPYLKDELELHLNYAKGVIHNRKIILIASFESEQQFFATELEGLRQFILAYNLEAGISRPFYNLKELRYFYLESIEALKIGKLIHTDRSIFQYEDYVIFHLIINFTRDNEDLYSLYRLIHPGIIKLLDYDKQNKSEYAYSLYTYIFNFKNTTSSAASLNIHRNSFFNRMEKIEKLTNMDLNHSDTLHYLYFSFKILELLNISMPRI
ncbi:PucR C-terminal helix-turn-helix domain-containing protein [Desulfitobacterium chlororespirans DSM 11544]|nr:MULTISPECIES: helix-turn-helix domain-containing protein [Desulfitobacterium]SHN49558.1 PucR C-terminal helix-turn-helix domain-containing protein [Desulfitobacterium chlororespirans DSM 11544]